MFQFQKMSISLQFQFILLQQLSFYQNVFAYSFQQVCLSASPYLVQVSKSVRANKNSTLDGKNVQGFTQRGNDIN